MRTNQLLAGVAAAGALMLAPACSDEDGDGATTDEEIQDVEDGADEVEDRVDEEIEGQERGFGRRRRVDRSQCARPVARHNAGHKPQAGRKAHPRRAAHVRSDPSWGSPARCASGARVGYGTPA